MKKFSAPVLALCIFLALIPCAAAEEDDDAAFQEIIDNISKEWEIPAEDMIAGYMNLVTGEEHYWQGDQWEYCGSMYKVPLTMYVSEKMAAPIEPMDLVEF